MRTIYGCDHRQTPVGVATNTNHI